MGADEESKNKLSEFAEKLGFDVNKCHDLERNCVPVQREFWTYVSPLIRRIGEAAHIRKTLFLKAVHDDTSSFDTRSKFVCQLLKKKELEAAVRKHKEKCYKKMKELKTLQEEVKLLAVGIEDYKIDIIRKNIFCLQSRKESLIKELNQITNLKKFVVTTFQKRNSDNKSACNLVSLIKVILNELELQENEESKIKYNVLEEILFKNVRMLYDFPADDVTKSIVSEIKEQNSYLNHLIESVNLKFDEEQIRCKLRGDSKIFHQMQQEELQLMKKYVLLQYSRNEHRRWVEENEVLLEKQKKNVLDSLELVFKKHPEYHNNTKEWLDLRLKKSYISAVNMKITAVRQASTHVDLNFQKWQVVNQKDMLMKLYHELEDSRNQIVCMKMALKNVMKCNRISKVADIAIDFKVGLWPKFKSEVDLATNQMKLLFIEELDIFGRIPFKDFFKQFSHVDEDLSVINYDDDLPSICYDDLKQILCVLRRAPFASPVALVLDTFKELQHFNLLKRIQTESPLTLSSLSSNVGELELLRSNIESTSTSKLKFVVPLLNYLSAQLNNVHDLKNIWWSHPFQCMVPESYKIENKSFKEWQKEFECIKSLISNN